ncbi:hypothetical protein HOY82DRAFT_604893 [Tuber indicum]|nr:hypothetical protein HOY82DRAFT_604893 [Tuber indicum]
MSRVTEFIFPASASSLGEPFPEILALRFIGATIPPALIVSPFDVDIQYQAVYCYSRVPLNLCKAKPLARKIVEEDVPEYASIVTGFRMTVKMPIRRWGVAVTHPTNPSAPQSLVNAMPEPVRLYLMFGIWKKRQSMDSGFAE